MPSVALRCKVSRKTGMGHLVRQSHLAHKLQSLGWKVTVYPDRYAPALERLESEQLPFIPVKNNEEFLKTLKPVDITVLDIQNTQAGWMKELRTRARRVAGFEDLGRGRHYLDLLIDCNLLEGKAGDLSKKVRALLGLEHCLLSPEFAKYSNSPRNFDMGIQTALITMGGTDPNRLTDKVVSQLQPLANKVKFTVVDPGFVIGDARTNHRPNIFFLKTTNEMAQLLASHDVVICSGGVTMHEAMTVGTPAFVIAQVHSQSKLARFAEQQGAVKYLGQAGWWNPEDLKSLLQTSSETLQAMSDSGRATLDGKGIERIVDALKTLI